MKSILFFVLSLVSSVAMADGFRCTGGEYRVQFYNQVDPNAGTRNPAVLVVAQRNVGTLAVVQGDDLQKVNTPKTVAYGGRVNSRINGHYMAVTFQVNKQPVQGNVHHAQLRMNFDGKRIERLLTCERYVKHPKN